MLLDFTATFCITESAIKAPQITINQSKCFVRNDSFV